MENFVKQEKTVKIVVKHSGAFSAALRKNIGGFRSFFTVSNEEKVYQTKLKIYHKSNIPVRKQVLKNHDGKILSDDHFTFEYVIRPLEVFVLLVQEDNVDASYSGSASSSSGGDAPDSGGGGFGGGNRGLGQFQENLEGGKKMNGGGYDGGGGGCAGRLQFYNYFTLTSGASLYEGDLHVDVTEDELYAAFNVIDNLVFVRVCKDSASSVSLGYGYVNYISTANLSIEKLNHTPLRGQMIRVMWSRRDSDAMKSGIANLFVKNLSVSIDNAKLHEMFSKYGNILSCKVAMTEEGKSKGYGFVQYETEESATAAINSVNGSTVEGKQIYVGPFVKKSERPSSNSDSSFTNLYIKNLDLDVTEELLTEKFSKYGKITHLVIMKDGNSKSKGFGFVNFDSPDEAKKAMEATNGMQIGSKVLYVGRAQKKAEREKILHDQFEERRKEQLQKFKGSNVYVKNIDDSVNDDELRSIFSKCGTITSAKIMLDEKGMSKGFGFVCFTTIEAAYQAVNGLHGYMLRRKPLYVAFAQKKEERRTQLLIQFSQEIAGLAVPTSAAVIPARYPPLYYTLPPNMVPPQGLMHQPLGMTPEWGTSRFLPPARPNFHSVPRSVIPDSSRQNKKKWGRMNAHMVAQAGGQSVSFMPHIPQSTPRPAITVKDPNNQQIKYMTNVQKMGEMKNGSQRVSSIAGPKSVGGVAATSQPLEGLKTLSTMLAAASPQHQKQMLGECLYPLVFKLQHDLAAKITRMLLEMDNSELLLLLESPASLVIKVKEAVQILKSSKTTRSSGAGQDSLHPNYMSAAQVAVN